MRHAEQSERPFDQTLLSVVDFGLAAVVLAAPWFMGGRHPLGEFVMVLIAVVVGLAWSVRQVVSPSATPWTRSSAELLLAGAVALVVLQLAPLPSQAIDVLSPHISSLLPLWTSGADPAVKLGDWSQVSLTPAATQAGLVLLLAYGILFIVALQRIRSVEDVERLFHCLAISTVLMAIVGLLQYLVSNGKFLWIYQHPFRDTHQYVVGPFINRNHFAHFLALGLGPLLWSIQQSLNRRRQPVSADFSKAVASGPNDQIALFVRLLGLGIVLFAGLMTLSRGGAAMMFLAVAFCLAAFYRAHVLSKKFLVGIVAVFVLIATGLFIHGYQSVSERLGDYAHGSISDLDSNHGRRKIWEADAKALPDFCLLGAGVGSHREIYPMYFAEYWETEYTHAENGYLQVALETGLPGIALLLTGIVLVAVWCRAGMRRSDSTRTYVCAAAAAASLLVSVVHSAIDFVWYIPSCMAMTVLLAACACRLAQIARGSLDSPAAASPSTAGPASRLAFAGLAAITVTAGTWMCYDRACAALAAPHWDNVIIYALSPEGRDSKSLPSNIAEDLEQIVHWTPDDARAHVRLAGEYLRRFDHEQKSSENVMALSQIRDAAISSKFASRAELDEWLSRAIGDTRRYLDTALWHTRRGLSSCPLQGEGYVYLAELCFLHGAGPAAKPAYVAQALKVRPYNGKVLFAAGDEAALTGDLPKAMEFWKQSFKSGPEDQAHLINLLSGNRVPVEFMLHAFEPDLRALRLMQTKYEELNDPRSVQVVLRQLVQVAEKELPQANEEQTVQIYLEMHGAYRGLKDAANSLACVSRAAAIRPNDFDVRLALAICQLEQKQFAEAESNLEWCAQRRPDDAQLKTLLTSAVKARVEHQARWPDKTRIR